MKQSEALTILKSGANVFLTGEPGSGKTHTINTYVTYLRSCGVEPAVTASTGIAATHIGGMTIHSWSGVGVKKHLSPYDLDKLAQNERLVVRLSKAKVLIIDEISMLDADTFSSVERICRTLRARPEPFGGLQVIVVGDFFQLPPVSRSGEAPYRFAFESAAWVNTGFIPCYLSEQYRQDDTELLRLLDKLRRGSIDQEINLFLEKRKVVGAPTKQATKLYTHNVDVDRINNERLAELDTPLMRYTMTSRGGEYIVQSLRKSCLSPEVLDLKEGASVMFTKNNPENGYVNGTLGTVVGFSKDAGEPIVKTKNNKRITVSSAEWSVEDGGKILATIVQVPLRLAWAITVHKSQGMTLDSAVMDLSQAFEYGQGYVALSRVRTSEGLHVLGWNRRALEVHPKILHKDIEFKNSSEEGRKVFTDLGSEEHSILSKNFIISMGGNWPPQKQRVTTSRAKQKTHTTAEKTLELIAHGAYGSLPSLAKARGVTEGTILTHLEALQKAGKLDSMHINVLFGSNSQYKKIATAVKEAFNTIGFDTLKPVYAAFGGKYSYDELRIARILLRSK